MRRNVFGLVLSLSLASGAIVRAEAPAGPRAGLIGVRPGEAFTFKFGVGPIEGARARMSVGLPVMRDGHALIAVQAQAETVSLISLVAPVDALLQLVIDASTLLPRELTTVEHGLRNRRFHSLVDGRAVNLEISSPSSNYTTKRMLPTEVRDPVSAYFALRRAPLANGDELTFDVLDGAALWHTKLRVVGREQIRLNEDSPNAAPPVRAIHIEATLDRIDDAGRPYAAGKTPRRTLSSWLSDDPIRAILRASFDSDLGRAKLELTSYVPPAVSTKPPRLAKE